MKDLDEIDLKLLDILQENGRLSNKELAQRVNLSTTPVYERIKRLENEGYINRYVALLDAQKLNLGLIAFCNIRLDRHTGDAIRELQEVAEKTPEIAECYNLAGPSDFLLKVYAPDMEAYRKFVMEVLGGIKSIGTVSSSFVMHEVKSTRRLPLSNADPQK